MSLMSDDSVCDSLETFWEFLGNDAQPFEYIFGYFWAGYVDTHLESTFKLTL